jgi:hypothetical protein
MTCLEQLVTYDLGSDFTDLTKDSVDYQLRLTDLAITLQSTTIADFGSVYEVRVGVAANSTLPAVDLATYHRSPANPTPTSISVRAMANVDLGAYVKSGQVALFTQMTFDQDIPAFNADVLGDFYLDVVVDYGKKAGIY